MDKKKIIIGSIILAIIIVTIGVFAWEWKKIQKTDNQNSIMPQKTEGNKTAETTPSQSTIITDKPESIDWGKLQFDICGGKGKYKEKIWWKKFITEIEKNDYYSEGFIEYRIESINNNHYLNPDRITYIYESYCNIEKNKNSSICMNKGKKLSEDNFNDYSEGCLSENNSAFIVVFSGEYMGGGNHIFRYNIIDNILEEAQRTNEVQTYGLIWTDPPTSFGEKFGNIIKMTGKSGDAGCSSNTNFDYDIATNQIKMTKRCIQCSGEELDCSTF